MSKDIALSKGRRIIAVSARLLSCDELVRYNDVIPAEIRDGLTYDHFCYDCYGCLRGIPFNRAWIGGRPAVGPSRPGDGCIYPVIVFETQDDIVVGEFFEVKGWRFCIISDTLAISCKVVSLGISTCNVTIYAKSDLKLFMDLWEKSLFDDDQPLLTAKAFDRFIAQEVGRPDATDVRIFEQGAEAYIEIDDFGTLNKYIPAINQTDIVLPEGIDAIRNEAFVLSGKNKVQFRSIALPKSLKHIEIETFMGIVDLERIELHPDNPYFKIIDGALFGCCPDYGEDGAIVGEEIKGRFKEDILICYPPAKCDLSEYTLPSSVIKIEKGAFCDSKLETVILDFSGIPKHFTEWKIKDYIFKNCKNLNLVQLINSKPCVFEGSHVFSGCNIGLKVVFDKKESFLVHGGLVSKNKKMLYYVNSDGDELVIPDGVERFNKPLRDSLRHMINRMKVRTVVLPDSLVEIPQYLFRNNDYIEKLFLGKNITRIDKDDFKVCKQLRYVEALGLESFDGFEECPNLEKIVLGSNCCNLPQKVVIEAPAGSQTIENAKNHGLEYIEI